MSSWLIAVMRGKPANEYDHTKSNGQDPWDATTDIAATANAQDNVRKITTWNNHVYAYMKPPRPGDGVNPWKPAEDLFSVVEHALRDGAAILANDTTDAGDARYYPSPTYHSHEYNETTNGPVGHVAAAVITANHGIIVRDPFHETGKIDDSYLEDGRVFEDGKVIA